MDVMDQAAIDSRMLSVDGTADKANIGANAILGVLLAVARAAAQSAGIPLYAHIAALSCKQGVQLPVPMMNILNGGAHANNPLDIQELGGRWIHDYSDRLSVYLGLGVANYNLTHLIKSSNSSFISKSRLSQLGLYSEIAGIVSITDRLYTGVRLDYSFANAKYASQLYKLSAISYGVVAGVSF